MEIHKGILYHRYAIEEAASCGLPDVAHCLLERGLETLRALSKSDISSLPSVSAPLARAGYISSALLLIKDLDLSQYLWSSDSAPAFLYSVQCQCDGSEEYKVIVQDLVDFICTKMLHWESESPKMRSDVLHTLSRVQHRHFFNWKNACESTKNLVLLLEAIHNCSAELGNLFGLLCGRGNYRMIHFLLKSCHHSTTVEGLVNKKDSEDMTPLFHATCSGRLSIVKLLLENGANLTRSTDLSPIVGAVIYLGVAPFHAGGHKLCWRSIGVEWEYAWYYDNGIRRNELDDYEDLLPKKNSFSCLCDNFDESAELVNLLLPPESEDICRHLACCYEPMLTMLIPLAAVRETSIVESLLSRIIHASSFSELDDECATSNDSEFVLNSALKLVPVKSGSRSSELIESFMIKFAPCEGNSVSEIFVAAHKGYWGVVEALVAATMSRITSGGHVQGLAATPLLKICCLAIKAGKIGLVCTLLQVAQAAQLPTSEWWTRLVSVAIHTNYPDTMSGLISAGCDTYTCLKAAAKWGRLEVFDAHLESLLAMEDLAKRFTGILSVAAQCNQQSVVQTLFQFYQNNDEIEMDRNFSRNTNFWLTVLIQSVRNGHQSLALKAVACISEMEISALVSQHPFYHEILYYSCYWGLTDLHACLPVSYEALVTKQAHESPLEAAIANGRLGLVYSTSSQLSLPPGDAIHAWLSEGPLASCQVQARYCSCTCQNSSTRDKSDSPPEAPMYVILLKGLFHHLLSMKSVSSAHDFTDVAPCNSLLCRPGAFAAFEKLFGMACGPVLVYAVKESQIDIVNSAVFLDNSILLEQVLRVLLSSGYLSSYTTLSRVSHVVTAIESDHTACLELLLRSGDVFVNQLSVTKSNGGNILHCAALGRNNGAETLTVVLRWLGKSASDMCFAVNRRGESPISLAFQTGKYERAAKLLEVARMSQLWEENQSVVTEWTNKAKEARGWVRAIMNYGGPQTGEIHSMFNIRSTKTSNLFKKAVTVGNSELVKALLTASCGLILTDRRQLKVGLLNPRVMEFLTTCPSYVNISSMNATESVCKSLMRRDCSKDVVSLINIIDEQRVPISLNKSKTFIVACTSSRLTLVQHLLPSVPSEVLYQGALQALKHGGREVAAAILLSEKLSNDFSVDFTSWTPTVVKLIFASKTPIDYPTIVEDFFGSLARPNRLPFSEEWLAHQWGPYQRLCVEKILGSGLKTPPNPWMVGVKWKGSACTVQVTIDWESFSDCLLEPPLTQKHQNTPLLVEAVVFSSSVLGQLCLTGGVGESSLYNLSDFFSCPQPPTRVVVSAVLWPHSPSACLQSSSECLLFLSYDPEHRVFVFPPVEVTESRVCDESYSTDSGMHSICVTDTSLDTKDNTYNTSLSANGLSDLCKFYQRKLRRKHHTSTSIAIEAGLMDTSVIHSVLAWCSEAIHLSSLSHTAYATFQNNGRMLCLSKPQATEKLFSHISINVDAATEGGMSSTVVSLVDTGLDFSITLAIDASVTPTYTTMPSFEPLLQQTVDCLLNREVQVWQRRFLRLITTRLIPRLQRALRTSVDNNLVKVSLEELNFTMTGLNDTTVKHLPSLKTLPKVQRFCDSFCDTLRTYSHKPKVLAKISSSFQGGFRLVVSEVSSTNFTVDSSPPQLTVLTSDLSHPQRCSALLSVNTSLLTYTQEDKQIDQTWLKEVPCPFLTHVDLKRSQKFLYPKVGVASKLIVQLVSYGGEKLSLPLKYNCYLEVLIRYRKEKAIRASSSEEPSSHSARTDLLVATSTDGQFEVVWTPAKEGLYSVALTLNGVEIQGTFKRVFVEEAVTVSGKRQVSAGSDLTFVAAHVGCRCPLSSHKSRVIITRDTVIEPSPLLKGSPEFKQFVAPFHHSKAPLTSPSTASSSEAPPERLRAAVSAMSGSSLLDSFSDPKSLLPLLHHISITAAHGGSKHWTHAASSSVTVHTSITQEDRKSAGKQRTKQSQKSLKRPPSKRFSHRVRRSPPKRFSRRLTHTQKSCTSVSLGNGMYRVSLKCQLAGTYKVFASCPLCQSVMKLYWLDEQSFYPQLFYVLPGPFSAKTSTISDMANGALSQNPRVNEITTRR